jgi:hypothetical protein
MPEFLVIGKPPAEVGVASVSLASLVASQAGDGRPLSSIPDLVDTKCAY